MPGAGDPKGLAVVVILQGDSWEWGSGNLIDGSALASHAEGTQVHSINFSYFPKTLTILLKAQVTKKLFEL